jgi:hypothetical protein
MINEIVVSVSLISSFLVLFHLTDGIPEWIRLLRLNKIFKFLLIDEYFKLLNNNILGITTYPEYLGTKYNYFIIRALTCPICSTFYFSLIAAFFVGILTWLVIFIISILIFYLLDFLMNKR